MICNQLIMPLNQTETALLIIVAQIKTTTNSNNECLFVKWDGNHCTREIFETGVTFGSTHSRQGTVGWVRQIHKRHLENEIMLRVWAPMRSTATAAAVVASL